MQINYSLALPRDAQTVAVVRRLCIGAMTELGVVEAHISDVALAVTEACANVIDHSSDAEDDYEVAVAISERRCTIRVIDHGSGFDPASLDSAPAAGTAVEHGRGITLMRALVDSAHFDSRPQAGTVVHLEKLLELEPDSPFRTPAQQSRADDDGARG